MKPFTVKVTVGAEFEEYDVEARAMSEGHTRFAFVPRGAKDGSGEQLIVLTDDEITRLGDMARAAAHR